MACEYKVNDRLKSQKRLAQSLSWVGLVFLHFRAKVNIRKRQVTSKADEVDMFRVRSSSENREKRIQTQHYPTLSDWHIWFSKSSKSNLFFNRQRRRKTFCDAINENTTHDWLIFPLSVMRLFLVLAKLILWVVATRKMCSTTSSHLCELPWQRSSLESSS